MDLEKLQNSSCSNNVRDWRKFPEYPTASEILASKPCPLPPNPVDQAYPNKDVYLETQYRLLRYEAVEPWRLAVQKFRDNPHMKEIDKVRIYTKVHVLGYTFVDATCRLGFTVDPAINDITQSQSERLKPDTIVVLSSDGFQTQCLVASVKSDLINGVPQSGHHSLTEPSHTVEVSFAQPEDALPVSHEMVMLETTTGYFESVRHTLLGLQRQSSLRNDFEKYVVNALREDRLVTRSSITQQTPSTAVDSLDNTQMRAYLRMTTKELAMIQGPPGTGKTFTSIVALENLVDRDRLLQEVQERSPPIIVAAQTNHALDQLLGLCFRRGIGKFARVGGGSCSPVIQQRTVNKLYRKAKPKSEPSVYELPRKELAFQLVELLRIAFPPGRVSANDLRFEGLITTQQYESLKETEEELETPPGDCHLLDEWIGTLEDDSSYRQSFPESPFLGSSDKAQSDAGSEYADNMFVSVKLGRYHRHSDIQQSGHATRAWEYQAEHYLATKSDLYDIKPSSREMVYRYLHAKLYNKVTAKFYELYREHKDLTAKWANERAQQQATVLQAASIDIIGCTTTGLTKYWALLAALNPTILMIEEAAETRESNITSGLFPTLKQLILVGDHQQLRPQTDAQRLTHPPYNLHVSLFERLINLKLPYTMLQVQRRMRPEIRNVVNVFYPTLRDHEVVQSLAPVGGMFTSLWWFKHKWPESRAHVSFYNTNEAEMIVGFVRHLVKNGTAPHTITVLCYYAGQVELIQNRLRSDVQLERLHASKEWSISTIDGFQGEENDVILLSLVRSPTLSNNLGRAGFVGSNNRATVALSRAKRGLYIFGNVDNLLAGDESSRTWQEVHNAFVNRGCLAKSLPVAHGKNVIQIKNPGDWRRIEQRGYAQAFVEHATSAGRPALVEAPASMERSVSMERPGLVEIQTSESLMKDGYFQAIEDQDKKRYRLATARPGTAMDEEDRFSASSAESERDNEPDEVMEDVDEPENEADPEEDNNDDEEEDEDDAENDNEAEAEAEAEGDAEPDADADVESRPGASEGLRPGEVSATRQKSQTPAPSGSLPWRPTVRPEALNARLYDIVPTMAAPQSTSVNAMAITPDMRYWFTGGSDGYIRKYDGPGTINGKLTLTVAQKHPFVDSVTKAGILMSYWENEEPSISGRGEQEHILSPVYSLAVHSSALWLLSGLESGGINLQSVRHDEGKKICCLQQHSNAVSVLTLAQDERSVLSGSWDKRILDWDLNTGQTSRSFDGSGGQISAIELRPASGDPIPVAANEPVPSTTISTNNAAPIINGGHSNGTGAPDPSLPERTTPFGGGDGQASPAHESLFGGSDAGSLFGDTAGEQPFGHDDDEFGAAMGMMSSHEGGMDHSADMAMASMDMPKDPENEPAPPVQPPGAFGGEAMELDAPLPSDTVDASTNNGLAQTIQPQPETVPSAPSAPLPNDNGVDDAGPPDEQQEGATTTVIETSQPEPNASSHILSTSQAPRTQYDPTQTSSTTFLSAAMDGTIRIWDRRVPNPVAVIGNRQGVPPWCMSACWSPNGNMIYAGRRNGTVEEYDIRHATRGWNPERVLKFPAGSGAKCGYGGAFTNAGIGSASYDILRLYDLQDTRTYKHSAVPFLIIPGPPRAGVISSLYIDPTSRFMLSAAGTRGWGDTSTEVLIGYEINVVDN
ncbi:Helicase required for RNAi-mediated heterochromatin assembly 1 [Paramyrothecium foliicola]|nr:Helicase required for RNAi-mediated heterochromatin assembly 1 [Paramyrothecium foliicola]